MIDLRNRLLTLYCLQASYFHLECVIKECLEGGLLSISKKRSGQLLQCYTLNIWQWSSAILYILYSTLFVLYTLQNVLGRTLEKTRSSQDNLNSRRFDPNDAATFSQDWMVVLDSITLFVLLSCYKGIQHNLSISCTSRKVAKVLYLPIFQLPAIFNYYYSTTHLYN